MSAVRPSAGEGGAEEGLALIGGQGDRDLAQQRLKGILHLAAALADLGEGLVDLGGGRFLAGQQSPQVPPGFPDRAQPLPQVRAA